MKWPSQYCLRCAPDYIRANLPYCGVYFVTGVLLGILFVIASRV